MEGATRGIALHFIGCGAGVSAKAARSSQTVHAEAAAVYAAELPASVRTVRDLNDRASSVGEATSAFRFWNFASSLIGGTSFAQAEEETARVLTTALIEAGAESGGETTGPCVWDCGANAPAGRGSILNGVSAAGAEVVGASQRRIHGVAIVDVVAAPIVAKLMTDQVGLARGAEPGFAKPIANVCAADGVKVGHADGAAIEISTTEHLDQIPLNTLLVAKPMAANLVQQAAGVGGGVRVTGIASDDDGGDGVCDINLWFVVEAVHVVDVGVDFGFGISAIVLVELVIHITGQFTFIEKSTKKSGRQVGGLFKSVLKFFVRKDWKVVNPAGSFAWFNFRFVSEHLPTEVVFFYPPSSVVVFKSSDELVSNHRRNHPGVRLSGQDAPVGVHWPGFDFDE